MRHSTPAASIDDYLREFPTPVKRRLQELRRLIQKEAPQASEKISYRIPTFYLEGNLVHFAGYERHAGFYPGAAAVAAFKEELGSWKHAKGSIQFPHSEPLPTKLVQKIVRFCVKKRLEARTK